MNIYLVTIEDRLPNFYVLAKTQELALGTINAYLSNNGYHDVPASSKWNIELINEACMDDTSIILSANS